MSWQSRIGCWWVRIRTKRKPKGERVLVDFTRRVFRPPDWLVKLHSRGVDIEQDAEVTSQGIGHLLGDHLDRRRKRVAGPHRASHQVQRLGKLALDAMDALVLVRARSAFRAAYAEGRREDGDD